MHDAFAKRGFLPASDPLTHFDPNSPLAQLDTLGHDLPSWLLNPDFRAYARTLKIPAWPKSWKIEKHIQELRLYYVRLGFIVSGYVNQVGQPPVKLLPKNLAVPFVAICKMIGKPPILSYDGYALYNWKRFDVKKPIELGNIDTIQNFVHLYDEHWFILIHVEIEMHAAKVLAAIERITKKPKDEKTINSALMDIHQSLLKQIAALKRIPELMSPELYFKTFRPYIRFFENVEYEGVAHQPISYRGETGAQSSIMPTLVQLMKIPHQPSALIDHLTDMRNYMPPTHKAFIEKTAALPNLKPSAEPQTFDAVLEAMAQFREIHYGWAQEYINKHVTDPRGTGGTPYMQWLKQLIDETRAHKTK